MVGIHPLALAMFYQIQFQLRLFVDLKSVNGGRATRSSTSLLNMFFFLRYWWSRRRNFKWCNNTCVHLGIHMDSRLSIHIGHDFFPLFLYPDKLSYARKPLTVHKSVAHNVNSTLACASNTETPSSHIFLKSLMRGGYTSMSFSGCLRPKIRSKSIMYLRFIHNQGGKL